MNQGKWICDGVPKNNNQQYASNEAHPPQENYGPDCLSCGLPKEAMIPGKTVVAAPTGSTQSTVMSTPKSASGPNLVLIAVGVLAALGVGFGLYKLLQGNQQPAVVSTPATTTSSTPSASTNPQALASETASNPQLISQGEKILLAGTANPNKTAGAAAFAQKNWDDAIAKYQQASSSDRNDPETSIYLNNAKAKKAGNPLTMAVVVPITPDPNTAKEIMRGVGQYQEKFNQAPPTPGRLLEVVVVNDIDPLQAATIAQDLIKAPNILGVMGHGVDKGSQQAIALYEQAGVSVISPVSTSITSSGAGQSTLKTISLNTKANEVLGTYLQTVGQTLAKYANAKPPASVVIFYNSDSSYSQGLKQQFTKAITQVNGKVVKEVDVTAPGFNATTEIPNAKQTGANIAFLALSKNKVDQAVAIANANTTGGTPLQLIGGDELYNPAILIQGKNAIDGLVLAVPWSSQPNDPFAKEAAQIWKGRVSWRTATAYDASQALATAINQNPTRTGVSQLLNQGVPISGNATQFNVFSEVPLVKAVKGSFGPPGSGYQFDPIK